MENDCKKGEKTYTIISDDIKLSVICTAYNHERYIRECLEGFVRQQTNFSFEVIVHDDASTDRTAKIIKEYEKQYPDIFIPIYQKENTLKKGINKYQNFFKSIIRGKYVAFCEGDDYWDKPDKLQKQYESMEEHPECSICFGRTKCINEDGTPNSRVIPELRYYQALQEGVQSASELMSKTILYGLPSHTSCVFIRKEVMDCELTYPRDEGLMRKALLCGDAYFIDEYLSVRRLFSVGNWNSRLILGGDKAIITLNKEMIEIDDYFDQFTKGRYAKEIRAKRLWRIINLNCYDHTEAKQLKEKYRYSRDYYTEWKRSYPTMRGSIRFYLFFYIPRLFHIFQQLDHTRWIMLKRRLIKKNAKGM